MCWIAWQAFSSHCPCSHLGSVSGVCPARIALSLTHFSVLTWHFRLQSHRSEHHLTHTRRGWPWGWQVIHSTNIYSMPGIVLVTGDTATNTPWFCGASVPIIGIRQDYMNKYTQTCAWKRILRGKGVKGDKEKEANLLGWPKGSFG